MTPVQEFKFPLSRRVLSIAPSATLAISAKAKEMKAQGLKVLSLSAGEPDFDTPERVKEAAIRALRAGETRYTPVVGTPELRKAIASKLRRDQGLEFDPTSIVVSVGAKHALFNVLFALLDENDEVLIPAPYWLSYPEMVTVLGGKPVILETSEKEGFKLKPETLRHAITSRSKVLILNSPSNPTGAVYSKEELWGLAAVLKDFPQLVILSDEIYEKLIFDGLRHVSIAQLDAGLAQRTVIINGHSKAYAMTGWRLGYAACPNQELARAVASIQSHSTSNPTSFVQAGGVAALEDGEDEARRMCAVFQRRRDFLFKKSQSLPGIIPFYPQGAFYLFANIAATGMDSVRFATALLEEAHVAVVPGAPFGNDHHVRLSFAASEEVLEEAVDRMRSWLERKR